MTNIPVPAVPFSAPLDPIYNQPIVSLYHSTFSFTKVDYLELPESHMTLLTSLP